MTILAPLLILPGCGVITGNHFEPMSRQDWALQSITTAALVVDWGQTRDIKNHEGYFERNI
ncbi:MAG: hypothetical protein P1P89_19680, partial [Desulfobacterales bacterium]|nr:hypothetical protein [Desulfobacterales bacterium]